MIASFKDRDTESVWKQESVKRLPRDVQVVAFRKLVMLNHAADLNDLRVPPGNRLERLKGDREGQHNVRVNDQWRVCFRWANGQAHDVEIVDYH